MFLLTVVVTLIVWNLPSSFFGIDGLTVVQQRVIAIFVMAVMLWLTEAIPAWATSVSIIFVLLFFVSDSSFKFMQGSEGEYGQLLDSVGIMACFADPTIILFLGGFILAIAATKSGLDVWMAKTMIRPFGHKSERIIGLLAHYGHILHVHLQHRHSSHDAYLPDTGIQGPACQRQRTHRTDNGHPHRCQPRRYGHSYRDAT